MPAARADARGAPADDADIISFARLGAAEQTLRGPFDAAYLDFGLPANWDLTGGATLQLNLTTFFASTAAANPTATSGTIAPAVGTRRNFGGTLQVLLNNITLETVLLDQGGERTITIPITTTALLSSHSDGRHVLSMLLDTHEPCGNEQYTRLIIRASSYLALPHRLVAPPTDLTLFPRPIYQRSFLPDAATIVLPDAPTAGELQAALSVAAGLGRMTDSKFTLALTPVGRLTDDMRNNTHLIFVGKPAAFPMLDEARLPAPVSGAGFQASGAATGDGVVQMVVSPWNAARVLLVVGGSEDSAVIKAAQAVSSGAIRTGEEPDIALVAAVQPQATASTVGVDRTFAELGYDVQKMYGLGGQYAGYRFDIPAGQAVNGDAYIDLVFVHTALLDYDQSSVTISLNDEPIASLRLDDNSTRLDSARISLPASALRAGSNLLTIRADLLPRVICTDPRGNGLWMTIRPESVLHLPLGPSQGSKVARPIDLSSYPAPFTTEPNFNGLAFVLAPNDPTGWQVAADIAFDLGNRMQGTLADLVTAYGDAVPDQVRKERDLLVIGRPSALPLIVELGGALPAPIAAGSDVASEPGAQVTYRIAKGESIGYLELLPAPWSGERTVLAVLGATDEGLRWAGATLTRPKLRAQLSGNLAVIDGERIASSDTRPKLAPATQNQPGPGASTPAPDAGRPSKFLLLAVAGIALVGLGGVVFLAVWWRRSRAKRRRTAAETQKTS